MLPVDFNKLFYFWRIARERNVSGAAKRLMLTQSTLSIQLKSLEASLGQKLLVRSRRGMVPTAAGETAFDYCERIFRHAEQLVAVLKSPDPSRAPVCRLGVHQSVPRKAVLDVIDRMQALRPGLRLRVHAGDADELVARLLSRMLDAAVSDANLAPKLGLEFRSVLLSRVPVHFVATPAVRDALGEFPAGLGRVPLLSRAPGHPMRKELDFFLHRHRITGDVAVEVDLAQLLHMMALKGQGVCMMDEATAGKDLARGRLVIVNKAPTGIYNSIWLFCARQPKGAPLGRVLDLLSRPAAPGRPGAGPKRRSRRR